MAMISLIIMCLGYGPSLVLGGNFDPYMDNMLFSINFPGVAQPQGKGSDVPVESPIDDNSVVVMTQDQEKYKCVLPVLPGNSAGSEDDEYAGPTELELLRPLLTQTSCSYRIESYWTYEMCHGKYLRQYHEEKEAGKKPKLQEYWLGNYKQEEIKVSKVSKKDATPDADADELPTPEGDTGESQEPMEEESQPAKRQKPPVHKVEGFDMPYYELSYTGGTKCDLTGGQRRSSVRYVCLLEGKGEVYELKESSTCEYEVIILTSLLCTHPNYQPKVDPINHIQCHPIEGSPGRPKSLETLERENNLGRYNKREFWEFRDFVEVVEDQDDDDDYDDYDDDDDHENEFIEMLPKVPKQKKPDHSVHYERKPAKAPSVLPSAQKNLVRDFLNGDYCLKGGHGWWKHEFCFGKHVTQYHEEKATGRVDILLGTWNEKLHRVWMDANPNKKPRNPQVRGSVSHFYGNGDICDLTGKPRFVEVKLKCKRDPEQPNAITIYLTESKACEYILVVESPILCNLISDESSDDYGIIRV